MILESSIAQTGGVGAWLQGIAAILAAIAWPIALSVILLCNRKFVSSILEVMLAKLSNAKRISIAKILEIEEEVTREIDSETTKSAESAPKTILTNDVPEREKAAAVRVQTKLSAISKNSGTTMLVVRAQMIAFAREYELIRAGVAPGSSRTASMNEIVAKMRTISLAAMPFLQSFSQSNSAGQRLAATTILQMRPQSRYIGWLAHRMMIETPFVFFNAALALLESVRKYGDRLPSVLRHEITHAKRQVESFTGGEPDKNTIDVLEQALRELEAITGRR
jgi:hypothetical protein